MIYFVDGIPAVGKSRYAKKLRDKLAEDHEVLYFKEEYKNPLDLLRQACLSQPEYDAFFAELKSISTEEDYRIMESCIYEAMTTLDNLVFIPFMHIRTQTEEQRLLMDSLYAKELDDGKCPCDIYCNVILRRLEKFLREIEDGKDYIFEGALFQNPLFTILGFYDVKDSELIEFYGKIEKFLSCTEYEVHFVSCDSVEKAILHAVHSRENQGGYSWFDGFERWFRQSRNYSCFQGINGIIDFAKVIKHCSEMMLDSIPFRYKEIKREV